MNILSPQGPSHPQKENEPNRSRWRELNELKSKVHQNIIDNVNLEVLLQFDNEVAREEIANYASEILTKSPVPLAAPERTRMVQEVVYETFGLGPLEPLLADTSIDEIMVNNYETVFIERRGKIEKAKIYFKDNTHLRHVINRIVARVGRRIDDSSPMVDARLSDGSRVNAIIPPLALDGPCLSIRRFKAQPLTATDLVAIKSISAEMLFLLQVAVLSKMNILISGGTGTGKTTLLNILSAFIPGDERIVTIEDAAELQLQQPHVVRLETRPPNIEGKGGVNQGDLFRNTLRMRPDRIIVGEVRGPEALDMMQAMNTGHEGSLTSIHANSPRDALGRLETMILMSGVRFDHQTIVRQIASALNIVVQIRRYPDGKRRIESICEVSGLEGDVVTMQELASFEVKQVHAHKDVEGEFKIHDLRPKFMERARELGILQKIAQGK
ncbi:MAG: CpaF family protein [Candidatus Omnitrophica bacterium]|nr:CpaF family protein [Candidatus Omnitrophota bacterium]